MRALFSVAEKMGVEDFARGLEVLGVQIVALGETANFLTEAGISVERFAEPSHFSAILGDTEALSSPTLHAAILARRDDARQMAELRATGVEPIDLVVCDLRAFAGGHDLAGVARLALLRSAVTNYQAVTVVTDPAEYEPILAELAADGATSAERRHRLAVAALQQCALYDTLAVDALRADMTSAVLPDEFTIALRRLRTLRYGENPHQAAALYAWGGSGSGLDERLPEVTDAVGENGHVAGPPLMNDDGPTVAGARLLHGKELSFNNLLDLDAALHVVASFSAPAAVVVKHTNPCGLACADAVVDAYRRAHGGDPISAYGGILGFNREVDVETAAEITQIFYEAIIAPSFSPDALRILSQSKNIRLLATNAPIGPAAATASLAVLHRLDLRRVSGGVLVQTPDVVPEQDVHLTHVSERGPTFEEITDLLFAWKAVQHVKSNAIVLAKKLTVVGVGAGQMNRVYSVQIAVDRAADRARGSVLASDAFFPFPDGVETAAKAGVTAIIQPGGSIRDDEVIRMANRYGIAMVTTGQRHFRH